MLRYRYVHSATEATTGYFACEPEPPLPLREALNLLAQRPMDDFLRRHILVRASSVDAATLADLLQSVSQENAAPALEALRRELALLNPALGAHPFFAPAATPAAPTAPAEIVAASPLIFLRHESLPDKDLQRAWVAALNGNIQEHRSLKSLHKLALPPLYPPADEAGRAGPGVSGHSASGRTMPGGELPEPGMSAVFSAPFAVTVADLHPAHAARPSPDAASAPPAAETAALAEERLLRLGIIAGEEMRHTASLSPVALLRPWNVRLEVRQGAHALSLQGTATTYGRGLGLDQARVSCLMEMVERASCYVSVSDKDVLDRPGPCPLVHGSRREILDRHGAALDPGDFPLEVPYAEQRLYWVRGHGPGPEAAPVWVPLQMAALFCNLDEVSLMDAPGSTGIATGASQEQARLAALLEIFERDAEATTPFIKEDCFLLEADPDKNPLEAALLADYAARGINVQFQDITGPAGVPAYQCFVMSPKGAVARGHGASLNGARAALSALTETPFPYPDGGPSGPLLRRLPTRKLHELPNYSLASHAADLGLLEDVLVKNGRPPVYVDMTRTGLDFPVVRALAPGFELAADRDVFSRVPPRLYRACKALLAGT